MPETDGTLGLSYALQPNMLSRFCSAAILAGSLVCLQGNANAQALYLQPPSSTLSPGTVASVDVRLDPQTGTPPAGVQWTLNYSVADLQILQITPGPAAIAAGKTVACASQTGASTCLVYGSNSTAMNGGTVATVSFVISNSFPGFTFLSLNNQMAASSTGSSVAMSASSAVLGASAPGSVLATPGCNYVPSPAGQSFNASGGVVSISITTTAGCTWQVLSAVPWITVTAPSSGTGSGAFTVQAASNTGVPRAGTVFVAGWALGITQAGSDGSPAVTSLSTGAMAHVVAGGPWKTTLTLVNTGSTQASAYLGFLDNAGNALPLPWSFPQYPTAGTQSGSLLSPLLAPGATFVMETAPAASSAVTEGWVQLQSQGTIQGFATFTNTQTTQESVVPLEMNGTGIHLLAFDNTNGVATGLAVANLSAVGADVPVTFRDSAGTPLGTSAVHLPPRGHTSFMLQTAFAATTSQRGTVEFEPPSGIQIGVLGLRANGAAITTLPILADPGGDGTGTMAHIVAGAGWKTTLTLVNTGPSATTAWTQWFDDNGSPLSLSLRNLQTGLISTASSTNDGIPALTSLVMETAAVPSSVVAVGSAQVAAPGANGFVIFRSDTTGQEAAVPMETRKAGSYILAFDNTRTYATGLAVANASYLPADIPVTIRDDTGALLGSSAIHLNGNGHTSFMLTQPYPYTAGLRGTVEFSTPAGGRISVIGLRGSTTGTLTTLPVLTRGN